MGIYKKVIVAIDLEGGADQVLKKAAQLVANTYAEVVVLNVVYTAVQMYGGAFGAGNYTSENFMVDEEEVKKELLPKIKQLAADAGLDNQQCLLEFGRAVDTILDKAEQESADLIILGSHGKHGLRLLLGSTANGVLHRSKCDVMAVRIDG